VTEFITNFGDECRNEYGSIRQRYVKHEYMHDNIDIDHVLDFYQEWRDDSEYFCLHGQPLNDNVPETYKFVKCAKRGNDVYKYLVNERLKPLRKLGNVTFFDDNGSKSTRLLFITLTYDPKLCNSDIAWMNIGYEFHLWCNNLRKHYN